MSDEPVDPLPVRFTTTVLIVIYAILVAFAVIASYRLAPFTVKAGFDNFAKVAGVLVSAVSAVMAATVTIVNFDRAVNDARNLATLNADLAKGIAQVNGNIAKEVAGLNGTIGQQLAAYKADLDRQLLEDKLRVDFKLKRLEAAFSKEFDAYKELMTAASKAYYTLAKMAGGTWKAEDQAAVDSVMSAASVNTALLAKGPHAELWERLWNRMNYIAESAAKLSTPGEQTVLWNKQEGELGSFMQEFQRALADKLHQDTSLPGNPQESRPYSTTQS